MPWRRSVRGTGTRTENFELRTGGKTEWSQIQRVVVRVCRGVSPVGSLVGLAVGLVVGLVLKPPNYYYLMRVIGSAGPLSPAGDATAGLADPDAIRRLAIPGNSWMYFWNQTTVCMHEPRRSATRPGC